MQINEINTPRDIIKYLEEQLSRDAAGDKRVDIAWGIADLMCSRAVEHIKKSYPVLEDIIETAADLEVSEKVVYDDPEILWAKIKRLVNEFERQIDEGDCS